MELIKCQGKCKKHLPRDSFYKNRSRENGLQITCKECTRESVKDYQKRLKEGLVKTQCVICGDKCPKNAPDSKCADCRHREKMRRKYHENPEYHKIKHSAWRERRAARNMEIEEKTIQLTKGEMFLLTRFNGDHWLTQMEINPVRLFGAELEQLHELGLIQFREVENSIKYALTEKGLQFLGIDK